MTKKIRNKKGFSVIEILVAIAIITFGLAGVLSVTTFSLKISSVIKETNQANFLTKEAIEAVRGFRDQTEWPASGLGALTNDTPYHPALDSSSPPQWQILAGEENIGIFSRKVVFSSVQRDGNYNIVEAGGVIDQDTKKATATVSWKNKQVEIITYFTNWK